MHKKYLLDFRKAPSSPSRIIPAANSFSSFDVPIGTSPSDKTVFARADSPWERAILRKSSLPFALIWFLALAVGFTLYNSKTASAVTAADWQAGRIIDDGVFIDKNSMSVEQIQAFLNSRVGTGGYDSVPGQCDSNGLRNAQPFSSSSRTQYGSARTPSNPKFTCLKDYYEVPKLEPGPGIPASNYGGAPIPAGAKSAAQLIWDAAQRYDISPKVLLVTIQKESAGPLTTDDWPFKTQYTYAMGAYCPDSGPGGAANCNENYAGFSIQISESAALKRYYLDNMDKSWWPYKKLGNNTILYQNAKPECGSSTVNITTKATAALYTYTPYQPNKAALDNLYGLGDGCSAYGNRNFWRIFSDWFGSTQTNIPYAWAYVSQEAYYDPARTSQANLQLLAPNQSVYLRLKARNMGYSNWSNTGNNPINLGTNNPQDHLSTLCDTTWLNCKRPATLKEATVAPGDVGTFEFTIKTPTSLGAYREDFNLVAEGQAWLNDLGLYYSFDVKPPTYSWQLINKQAYRDSARTSKIDDDITLSPGSKAYFTVKIRNAGNEVWTPDFLKLGTWGPQDRQSTFRDASWPISIRAGQLKETSLKPGQIGSIEFTMQAPQTTGSYKESFNLVAETRTWLNDLNLHFNIDVVAPVPPSNSINTSLLSGQTLKPGQNLLSPDRHSVLALQKDGNLVFYSDFKPVWYTNTAGSASDRLVMQSDGNLVLYDKNDKALWNSATPGNNGSNLIIQSDGNLVLYSSSNQALWATYTIQRPDHLSHVNSTLSNAVLYQGQQIETANRKYRLILQTDGNLVLYSDKRALWATYTLGRQNSYLVMQTDGNLVLYDANGQPFWHSSTGGKGQARLVMQADGNLVIYNSADRPIWDTATHGQE